MEPIYMVLMELEDLWEIYKKGELTKEEWNEKVRYYQEMFKGSREI